MIQTYTDVMTMMPAVTKQDTQGRSEVSILYDIHNAHLVDYKDRTTLLNIIAFITMMPAVTRQDIQGTSEKSILYDIPNVLLVPLLNIVKTSIIPDNYFSTTFCFAHWRSNRENSSSLSAAAKRILACLHFQQSLSIEV